MVRKTSLETYHRIKEEGILSLRRWQVFDTLFHCDVPQTGGQVAALVKAKYGSWGHSETIRNRLTELRDMGCISEVGTGVCPISGNSSILWQTNDQLPKKLEKKSSKARELIAEIRRAVSPVLLGPDLTQKIDRFLRK